MRNVFLQSWNDLLGLFYPELCLACREKQAPSKHIICLRCRIELPQTNFHLELNNTFTERFWGRIPLHTGTAMFHFVKDGRIQKMIHALKYEGHFDIGVQLGRWYGRKLKESDYYANIDIIVPVPLHPRKQHQRGYNQSDAFAKGLSESLEVPWFPNGLQRGAFTSSQTEKTREERFANVIQAFFAPKSQVLEGKHILLVDDVLTTGATLEACATKLLAIPNTKVSMATIAIARY